MTECLGIGVVGLVLMAWGLSAGASSGALGKLATKVPPIFIMMAGIVGDAAVILFLIYWRRVPSYIAVFVVAVMFGLEDGVWNTIPTSEGSQCHCTSLHVWRFNTLWVLAAMSVLQNQLL